MELVQILLPLYDRTGQSFERARFEAVARELTARFGGLTAYARAPARGLWEDDRGQTARDDIVVYEVMVDSTDAAWWAQYRLQLQARFAQDQIVVRAWPMRRL